MPPPSALPPSFIVGPARRRECCRRKPSQRPFSEWSLTTCAGKRCGLSERRFRLGRSHRRGVSSRLTANPGRAILGGEIGEEGRKIAGWFPLAAANDLSGGMGGKRGVWPTSALRRFGLAELKRPEGGRSGKKNECKNIFSSPVPLV